MRFSHRLSTRHPGDMHPVLCARVYLQQPIPFGCSSERDLLARIIFTLFPPRLLYVRLQNGRSHSKSELLMTKNHCVRCALACDRFSAAGTKIFVAFDSATLRKKPRCLESECLNSTHVNFLCLILQKYSMRGCYEMPIWSTFEKHEAARFPLTPIQMTFPTPSMKQTRLTPLYLLFYFGIL